MLHDEMQTLCRVKRIDSSMVRLQDFHHCCLRWLSRHNWLLVTIMSSHRYALQVRTVRFEQFLKQCRTANIATQLTLLLALAQSTPWWRLREAVVALLYTAFVVQKQIGCRRRLNFFVVQVNSCSGLDCRGVHSTYKIKIQPGYNQCFVRRSFCCRGIQLYMSQLVITVHA